MDFHFRLYLMFVIDCNAAYCTFFRTVCLLFAYLSLRKVTFRLLMAYRVLFYVRLISINKIQKHKQCVLFRLEKVPHVFISLDYLAPNGLMTLIQSRHTYVVTESSYCAMYSTQCNRLLCPCREIFICLSGSCVAELTHTDVSKERDAFFFKDSTTIGDVGTAFLRGDDFCVSCCTSQYSRGRESSPSALKKPLNSHIKITFKSIS